MKFNIKPDEIIRQKKTIYQLRAARDKELQKLKSDMIEVRKLANRLIRRIDELI